MIDYDALREALRDECFAACFDGSKRLLFWLFR